MMAKAANKRYEALVMVRTRAIVGKGSWYWAHLEPMLVLNADTGLAKAVKLRCSLCEAVFSASNPSRTATEHLKRGTCPMFATPPKPISSIYPSGTPVVTPPQPSSSAAGPRGGGINFRRESELPFKRRKAVESSSEIEGHGSLDRKDDRLSSENEGSLHNRRSNYNPWTEFSNFPGGGNGERSIGKLRVSRTEIGRGSNGTIVVEGSYEGRAVAVKRVVLHHCTIAVNEICYLIKTDRHPNIVRYYGMEQNDDFMFLALEHAVCSLDDLIQAYLVPQINSFNNPALVSYKKKLDSIRVRMQDVELWRADGHPSPLLLNLMRGVVSGLLHLHDLRLIHRDLKPQNVLITENRSLVAQLSDMGITKCLPEDKSSLGTPATGCGTLGWQAPEQLLHGHQTRAMDMFNLGLVLFFCITCGGHPFGKCRVRDFNIENNKKDLSLVDFIPEAHDLISRLLEWDYKLRPKASEVLCHPFFWSLEMRLSFFRDTSDRVQLEAKRAPNSDLLNELESKAPLVFDGNWDEKIEPIFLADICEGNRRYNYNRLRDLLRVVRNKWNHYIEIPEDVQELLRPVPEGYYNYFAKRFPRLLMESYGVISQFCKEEECFRKYF